MTTLATLVRSGKVLCDSDILITYGHKSASITNHGYVMVVYKSGNNWHAKLSSNGATYSIGSYKSEKQAALAYDAEVYRVHGELAYLNFPEELNHGKIN